MIEGKPRFSRLVSINKDTGEILVAGSIDREVFSWINLTVTATDSGWPARSSQAGVFIKVMKMQMCDFHNMRRKSHIFIL